MSQPVNDASEDAPPSRSADFGWVKQLIETEGPAILRLLWRLLGREQDVMDAYQDCFCNLASHPKPANLRCAKAYAYRTATNIAIEMIRVRRRRSAHWPAIANEQLHRNREHVGAEDPPDADRRNANSARLLAALSTLPAHLRNVIVLRDLSCMSYKEIGRTLGIQSTTARVYRRHAIVQLTDLLDKDTEL